MKKIRVLIILLGLLGASNNAFSASDPAKAVHRTSADLANESVLTSDISKAEGKVEIGIIMPWTKPGIPDGWLECAGQTISISEYPEYVKQFGSQLPDFRGVFLRGYGTNQAGHSSGGLGIGKAQTQMSSFQDHTHSVSKNSISITSREINKGNYKTFQDAVILGNTTGPAVAADAYLTDADKSKFPSQGVAPDVNKEQNKGMYENRPSNIAVKYIIKVK